MSMVLGIGRRLSSNRQRGGGLQYCLAIARSTTTTMERAARSTTTLNNFVTTSSERTMFVSTQDAPLSNTFALSSRISSSNSCCNDLGGFFIQTRRLFSSNGVAFADESSESMNDESSSSSSSSSGAARAYTLHRRQGVRNVAIIAHVDHGKTTLVDQLLRAAARRNNNNNNSNNSNDSSSIQDNNSTTDRLLDSGELEKERGITITSKITRVEYNIGSDETMILNIVDTPGHADFCAEVDRILDMVDGVCLVVDAAEGPMTQTKYVLSRALAMHLKPIVVLNKCDRVDALAQLDNGTTEVALQRLFEMLLLQQSQNHDDNNDNEANNTHDYVTMYASARQGWVVEEDPFTAMELAEQYQGANIHDDDEYGMHKLLDVIVREIPEPSVRVYHTDHDDNDDNNTTTSSSSCLSRDANFFATVHPNQPLSMAAVTVGYDPYLGRTCTGRIVSGSVQVGDAVVVLSRQQQQQQQHQSSKSTSSSTMSSRNNSDAASAASSSSSAAASLSSTISGIFVYKGIHRIPFPESGNGDGTIIASAGDCVTLAGVPHDMAVGDTLTSLKNPVQEPLSTPPLAPPTLAMDWSANQGPLAGQDGTQIASSKIQQRLQQETDNNVTLSIEPQQEKTVVLARGELQLGILIEQMRREGFEIVISPPRILTYQDEHGQLFEPFEEVTVDVDAEYSGTVVSALTGDRKGILMEMINSGQGNDNKNNDKNNNNSTSTDGKSRLIFQVPSRGLLGFHSEIATLTKGSAVVNHVFLEDRPHVGSLHGMTKSKLVSSAQGKATAHALASLAARGTLFIEPGDLVYSGMVIGENSKTSSPDLEVNPVRAKDVTNMRTVAKDEKIHLPPAKKMSVEELIGYMNEDEVLEVTPHHIRLRKALLDASARERAARNKAKQLRSAKGQ